MLWTANIHHIMVLYQFYLNVINSECKNNYFLSFVGSDLCFFSIEKCCIKTTCFVMGFLTYDYILLRFYLPINSKTS